MPAGRTTSTPMLIHTDTHEREPQTTCYGQRNQGLSRQTGPQSQRSTRGEARTTPVIKGGLIHLFPEKGRVWWVLMTVLLLLTGIAVVFYSIAFLVVSLSISLTNTWQYGSIHTSYLHTSIAGVPATITSSNDAGTIVITVRKERANGKGEVQSYLGPALSADGWNNDVSSVVAIAQMGADQRTIKVTLIGSLNYFHLWFERPCMTFSLSPSDNGYTVGPPESCNKH